MRLPVFEVVGLATNGSALFRQVENRLVGSRRSLKSDLV